MTTKVGTNSNAQNFFVKTTRDRLSNIHTSNLEKCYRHQHTSTHPRKASMPKIKNSPRGTEAAVFQPIRGFQPGKNRFFRHFKMYSEVSTPVVSRKRKSDKPTKNIASPTHSGKYAAKSPQQQQQEQPPVVHILPNDYDPRRRSCDSSSPATSSTTSLDQLINSLFIPDDPTTSSTVEHTVVVEESSSSGPTAVPTASLPPTTPPPPLQPLPPVTPPSQCALFDSTYNRNLYPAVDQGGSPTGGIRE